MSRAPQVLPRPDGSLHRIATVGAACLVMGVAVGILLSRTSGPRPAPLIERACPEVAEAPPPPTPFVMGAVSTRLSDEDKAALRRVIREEIVAARDGADGGNRAAPAEEPTASAPSDDDMKAYDRAHAAIDGALARGSWTEDDRRELRANLAPLAPERRAELIRPLVVAINQQKVHYQGHGPPM